MGRACPGVDLQNISVAHYVLQLSGLQRQPSPETKEPPPGTKKGLEARNRSPSASKAAGVVLPQLTGEQRDTPSLLSPNLWVPIKDGVLGPAPAQPSPEQLRPSQQDRNSSAFPKLLSALLPSAAPWHRSSSEAKPWVSATQAHFAFKAIPHVLSSHSAQSSCNS